MMPPIRELGDKFWMRCSFYQKKIIKKMKIRINGFRTFLSKRKLIRLVHRGLIPNFIILSLQIKKFNFFGNQRYLTIPGLVEPNPMCTETCVPVVID